MDLFDAIRLRTSCRDYRPDPVPDALLGELLEAARLAPSACNRQPWRFAVVRAAVLRRRLVDDGFLPGLRMPWAREAPVLVVLGIQRDVVTHRLGATLSGVDYPWLDAGIAGEHLVLAAAARGVGSCWIGWIRPRVVARLVGWPRSVRAVSVISLGYPRETPQPGASAEHRRPLDELVRWL